MTSIEIDRDPVSGLKCICWTYSDFFLGPIIIIIFIFLAEIATDQEILTQNTLCLLSMYSNTTNLVWSDSP